MFGRISRKSRRWVDMPVVSAASTNCWRSTTCVVARASRANPGMKMMPIAIMALIMLVPRPAMITIASRIAGKA